MSPTTVTLGAVFVGGASSRMGTDKATLEFAGRPLASYGIDALRSAGIDRVVLVGASPEQSAALGVEAAGDLWPGEGPAGAILSALHAAFLAGANTVVTLACDLPAITGDAITALLAAAPDWSADPAAVIALDAGQRAYPNGVFQTRLLPALEARFVDEANSVRDLLGDIEIIEVDGHGAFADADGPEDLERFL